MVAQSITPVDVRMADCTRCVHRDTLLVSGGCVPGDVCLIVQSGRQIDRFLRRNREFAEGCLNDFFGSDGRLPRVMSHSMRCNRCPRIVTRWCVVSWRDACRLLA